jgi:hypothetical protein
MSARELFEPQRLVPAARRSRRGRNSGFAYLMALFMVVAVVIASQVALQNLATEGRRMREQEMIWRGEQCARAIKLYYRKTGHYPQTMEDLQKGMPELHFLRAEAYKDPINKDGGDWRMIYVNATGQIIGSTRYATYQQMAIMDMNGGKMPDQAAIPGAVSVASMASGNQPSGQSPQGSQQPGQSNAPSQGATGPLGQAQPGNPLAQLKPTGPVDGPVLGGFLTGVASKVDRSSVKVYKGGTKYLDWEFIWNPVEDQARAVQQGLSPQGAVPGQPGQPVGPGGIGSGPAGGIPPIGGAIIPPGSNPPQGPAPQQ